MRRWVACFLLITLCFSLSCARRPSAWEVLEEEMAARTDLPHGVCYRSDAREGEGAYASETLLISLYGADAPTLLLRTTESYAIYLSSFATPCELAVFRLYAKSDTARIFAMCMARLEELRVLLRHTEHADALENATVTVRGHLVLFCIPPSEKA